MKDVVVKHLLNSVIKYKDYDEIKLTEIKYGIESFYLTITKTLVIFGIAYLLGIFKTLVLFMLFYTLLRINGAGLHAKKSWQCWISSSLLFLTIPYFCTHVFINKQIMFLVSLLCLIFIFIYSPADTEKRPIINPTKRKVHKILCTITTIIYILLIAFLQNNYLCNIMFFSIILQTILILPISYKIFGLGYDNYKNYHQQV